MANRPPLPYDFLPQVPSFALDSDDIATGQRLPQAQVYNSFGHSGENISPHLRWSGFPAQTRSFTVTCYDPDAPTGSGFWHWVLVNLPGDVTELPAGAGAGDSTLPGDAFHVRTDYGTADFGGAAPPAGHGPHRYVFAVHAVGVDKLEVTPDVTPAIVGFNLFFNTVARALLIPEYEA